MSPYEPQTWADGAGGGTPISADRLNHIEAGIAAAVSSDGMDGAVAGLVADAGSETRVALNDTFVAFGTDVDAYVASLQSGALYTYTLLDDDGNLIDIYTGKVA